MPVLIGDRFLIRGATTALDCATGTRVRLRIAPAGTRMEQESWTARCTRALEKGSLLDFGFVGTDRRFEARRESPGNRRQAQIESATVVEWLDHAGPCSPRILKVDEMPDARVLRLNGFVPCALELLDDVGRRGELAAVLAGRSVVLLDRRGAGDASALALLYLCRVGVRGSFLLSRRRRARRLSRAEDRAQALCHRDEETDGLCHRNEETDGLCHRNEETDGLCHRDQEMDALCRHVDKAAESHASYGGRPAGIENSARVERPSPDRLSHVDPRALEMFRDVERFRSRGRHAAAERALRSAVAALDRRGESGRAGDAGLRLGRLLLERGRPADAKAVFSDAHDRFQRIRAASRAVEAAAYLGIAQTDLAQLHDAERTCRAAYSAASSLQDSNAVALPATALVRTLLWQRRHAEARSLLESIVPPGDAELGARYWCLVARLRLAVDAVADAWRAIERARPAGCISTPAVEAMVRECEAGIQARLGDFDAVRHHVTHGLAAARAARLPLRALKLRLTCVQGLIAAHRFGQARSAARHLSAMRSATLPPLLRSHIDSVLGGLDRQPAVHESAVRFHVATLDGDVQDLDGLRELLSGSHQLEDEVQALTRAAGAIRRHLNAVGVGMFGWRDSTPRMFASAGIAGDRSARRAIDAGQPIRPERAGRYVEGAVPVQYLGRVIGAISMRWALEGPPNVDRAMAFGAAAAAACAPLVYVLIERQLTPAIEASPFDLIGVGRAIEELRRAVARAAGAPFTVLLEGESGSGKELVARAIHQAGCRRERRFCALNCAAMPEDLVDAELFGHAKGAFTGATVERLGLFESADGGTVFLDEVGELSARAQAKVLRVLQEGEIRRIGETFTRPFDARLVAATNRPLRAEVDAGRFRHDLLYRLDVIRIQVPPLRERVEDIPLLAARFWKQSAERMGSKAVLGQSAISTLARYDWPGNVRELQNVLAALVVSAPPRGVVGASDLPAAVARAAKVSPSESLESARLKFEERFVRAALARAGGHRGRTAAALGLSRQGLAKLMQRLHLDA